MGCTDAPPTAYLARGETPESVQITTLLLGKAAYVLRKATQYFV